MISFYKFFFVLKMTDLKWSLVLCYLCLFANSGFQHILYCVFLLCLCSVYPMLPVSLDWPLLIAPSVFSDVYVQFTKPPNRNECTLKRLAMILCMTSPFTAETQILCFNHYKLFLLFIFSEV